MCEKFPGKSLPRARSAEVGAPPRETRMSPLCGSTPAIVNAGVRDSSAAPLSIRGMDPAGACSSTSSRAVRPP